MSIQSEFKNFNDRIRLDYKTNSELASKRDILLEILEKDENLPSFKKLDQGSYAMYTGVKPGDDREYDIDVGLRFNVSKSDYNPMDLKKDIEELLKDHTDYGAKIKKSCVNDESIIYDESRFAGGLTNYNYIMNIKNREYVIRKPGGMTDEMIDRKIEKINQGIAADLGLNSETIYFDDLTGIKISVYIQNSKNIAQCDPNSLVNLKSVSKLIKKLHISGNNFPNSFDFKTELGKYEEVVRKLKGDFFFDYNTLKKQLFNLTEKNIKNPISVPCHNDTVPENFIVDGNSGRTYLIDWEYAGMNDPSWDVAAYILESRLTKESIEYLVLDYYGQQPTAEEVLKIKCYMLEQDLLWTVWALIRHYNGDDFMDYGHMRYERFRKNIKEFSISTDYPISEMVK